MRDRSTAVARTLSGDDIGRAHVSSRSSVTRGGLVDWHGTMTDARGGLGVFLFGYIGKRVMLEFDDGTKLDVTIQNQKITARFGRSTCVYHLIKSPE